MFDMLSVEKPIVERELEQRMMLELGHGFAFIVNQYRV